jgi:N,N-dimethylformamidase
MPDNLVSGPMRILGYCDRPNVRPGETLNFYVSCAAELQEYQADIVRLVHGDLDLRGPGFKEEVIETAVSGHHPARTQATYPGSYAIVPDRPELAPGGAGFTVQAFIWPTTPAKGRQGIVTKWSAAEQAGYGLFINEHGRLELLLGDGHGTTVTVSIDQPLTERCWYLVSGSYDPRAGIARLRQEAVVGAANAPVSRAAPFAGRCLTAEREGAIAPGQTSAPLVMAGWTDHLDGEQAIVAGHYNGKLDRPRLAARPLGREEVWACVTEPTGPDLVGAWDFSEQITPDGVRAFSTITDRSPHGLHGRTVNAPVRAVTGYNWSGEQHVYTQEPGQYGAIHFHDDSVDDVRWDVDFQLTVPDGLRSGVYAARLQSGEHEDYVPFYVLPPKGIATARIAFLAPTNSYLAYANDHMGVDAELIQLAIGRTAVLAKQDIHRHIHRELGNSLYDLHTDGSGVCYSSWRRPLLTVRPKYRHSFGNVWQFNADLHLIDWFTEKGFEVDVITDRDLHDEGAELLKRYRVVVTGSHPEYTTGAMLDAVETYLQDGGRLMYMGGNGFYWVTNYHPENPHLIEIRRHGGTQMWTAAPGEHYLSFTGEMGGLWRNRGRAPQKIVGVGFIAQGLDISSYYRRKPDSFTEGGSWVFDGIGEHELIGDFGLCGNGAAGLELDWYEPSLGSPAHAYLLASSEGHTNVMLEVRENFGTTMPAHGGDEQPNVRADMVYFTTPNDGGVFSTGSIAWCGSLSHQGYDNNVSRITENVLRKFASDDPLPR